MIISDTHGKNIWTERIQTPPSQVDVVLHCGDLSGIGGMSEYNETMQLLEAINAELKLVIAGNHDISLDKKWWAGDNLDEDDNPKMPEKAYEFWTGPKAKQANVVFLDEGLHQFTLKSGASFSIFATPFTPEFGGYAFSYSMEEDHFSTVPPKGIDILMTHGPANGFLDKTSRGEHAGCLKLANAVARVRPKVHCFGHIHDAYGAESVFWGTEKPARLSRFTEERDGLRYVDIKGLLEGQETLLVNAAMVDEKHNCTNAPWLVDISLAHEHLSLHGTTC